MSQIPHTYYTKRLAELQAQQARYRKEILWLGVFRLLTFIAIFPALFVLTPKLPFTGISITLSVVSVFLYLVKVNLKKNRTLQYLQQELEIVELEIKALEYEFSSFDTGSEFIDPEHAYSYDMDVFGTGSIFQFIARTVTVNGKKLLANLLHTETLDGTVITQRQETIKELAKTPEDGHKFRSRGKLEPDTEEDLLALAEWLSIPHYYTNRKVFLFFIRFLPYLTTALVVLAFFFQQIRPLAIMLLLIQLAVVGRRMKHSSAQHGAITRQKKVLDKYSALINIIEKKIYTSIILTEIQNTLQEGEYSASSAIKKLTKIVSSFDNRINMLMGVFLQGLFMWDLQCVLRLERWKQTYGQHLDGWINALAQYDAFLSFANMAFNNPDLSYPSFSSSTIINASNLGHILLAPHERICNDFSIHNKGEFVIITGANMAGKSTFLRCVASNMILAMTGAPVCATSFTFKPMPMFSSMRTSDSLNKHESYFYAELKRLKTVIDRIRKGEQLFVILDEILKGTNSVDKQKGSFAALSQIIQMQGTGIIATHDLELAKIENEYPDKVRNMCFEIEIDQANISFDYKLLPGITTKMNALLLMKQMGVVQD